jgi:hypothetical protein
LKPRTNRITDFWLDVLIEAIGAFARAERSADDQPDAQRVGIVCVDPSADLLAGLNALLTRSGYEVFTTRYAGEAETLAKATRPGVVIFGPGMVNVPTTPEIIENIKEADGTMKVLQLPSGFYTGEAGEAGQDLLAQVRALLAPAGEDATAVTSSNPRAS